MRDNKELMRELEEGFRVLKKELKLKYSFEEFDRIFFIKDLVLQQGFVSSRLDRTVCSRIANTFESWGQYIQAILMPPHGSLVYMSENQIFDKKEKEELMHLMAKILAFTSTNSLIGQTDDKKLEANFMNDAVKLWRSFFNPKFAELVRKVNKYWVDKSKYGVNTKTL